MSLTKLSVSYKCVNSIGNSLNLEEMMEEFLRTFIKETGAISGSFFVNRSLDLCEEVASLGKKNLFNIESIKKRLEDETLILEEVDKSIKLLAYKVKKGCLIFFYSCENDFDFITSILESLKNKIEINIDSCLNVENLKEQIEEATKENLEKERQLFEQLKMSQMGELIGNIAHQWRQPLNIISTATSGMQIKKELDILTDEDFKEYTKSILENSSYLSGTIDEFRDYIKDSNKEKEIIVQDRLKMATEMLRSSFSLESINIIEEFVEEEKLHFKLVLGDLLQVLITIFNNAKEALVEKDDLEYKWIKYSLRKTDYTIKITIEDNAGGVNEEIKDKIFNPYFTTKHQARGTGIGLYSAYGIIVNKLDGKLYVKNTEFGAKFYIELPLNVNYII